MTSKALRALLVSMVLLISLFIVSTASAWSDASLGTFPYVAGGVATKDECVTLMKKASTQHDWRRMMTANHVPKWAQSQIIKKFQDPANIQLGSIKAGTHVGIILVKYGQLENSRVWRGPSPLRIFSVGVEKTTTVKVHGVKKLQTVKYRSAIPLVCANGFVYGHKVTYKPVPKPKKYPVYVVKTLDCPTGQLLAGVAINVTAGGRDVSVITNAVAPTFVMMVTAGTLINSNETLLDGYAVVSPPDGKYVNVKMPNKPLTLTFVNKVIPPPTYPLYAIKRQDTLDGPLIANWPICFKVGQETVNVVTNGTSAVLVGYYPAGTTIDALEAMFPNWVIRYPEGGRWLTVMPACSLILTWVNSYVSCPTPTPTPTCTPPVPPSPPATLPPEPTPSPTIVPSD